MISLLCLSFAANCDISSPSGPSPFSVKSVNTDIERRGCNSFWTKTSQNGLVFWARWNKGFLVPLGSQCEKFQPYRKI